MLINHDEKYDVLSLSFAENSHSYGCDEHDGIVVFRNMQSDEITGVMIYDFTRRYNDRTIMKINFPFQIDFEKDVMPYMPARHTNTYK
jgi:hypothetical protein